MFLFGLWPRFFGFVLFSAVCFAVSAGETQVWLGDLRVVFFGVVVVFVLLLHRFAYSKDLLSLYRVLTAYSHVRTEPLVRHRPHSRKKKVISGILAGGIPGFRFELCCFSPSYLAFFVFCVFSVLLLIGGHYPMTHKMSSCMIFPLLVAIPLLCVLFGLFWLWLCVFCLFVCFFFGLVCF